MTPREQSTLEAVVRLGFITTLPEGRLMRIVNMIGKRSGKLVVVARAGNASNGAALWSCACDCGRSTKVQGSVLRNGRTTSCGCVRLLTLFRAGVSKATFTIAVGDRFGYLTALSEPSVGNHRRVLVRCDCGAERHMPAAILKKGARKSCGCMRVAGIRQKLTKHGVSRGLQSREYRSWQAMRARCGNPRHRSYQRYGGRGIKVCERWNDFSNFLADMGPRLPGTTLDRYPNNDGNYEPGNCRWATSQQQNINKSKRKSLGASKSLEATAS